jgi:predicted glutamine amidotransferase
VNIVREKNYEVGKLGFGGDYGPIEFASNGWHLRFFIISYDELETELSSDSKQFDLMTTAKLEKGFLSTKIADFSWQARNSVNGTTRIEDEILTKLNNDSALRALLLNELSKERAVTIKSYKPKKTPEQTGAETSYAQIVIYGEVRKRKDIFISRNCFDMYNKIAEHVLQVKAIL